MYNFYSKNLVQPPGCLPKIMLVMMLLTTVILQANAQKVTLSEKNAPLSKVFEKISEQTGFDFLVSTENLKQARAVTVHVRKEELRSALDQVFADQPLTFVIREKIVVVSSGKAIAPLKMTGQVTDTAGRALSGATIKITGRSVLAWTDAQGKFAINARAGDELTVSFVGYEPLSIHVRTGQLAPIVVLHRAVSTLNEVQIIGYGTTTRRLNTGSVSSIKAADIERQPVSNPLAALEGRVPGLLITQSSGVNGAGFKVQLDGQSSLLQGSDPFFVIDGVPFAPGNSAISQVPSAAGFSSTATNGISPFSLINPDEIESIEVLKDADATAIYGSRGANGVILITTKKGKAGKTVVNANVYSGYSELTRTMDYLNTQQYVHMRKEAFKNDGLLPDATNAPDLLLWDTTRYTDFKKLLIGNTAHTNDAQLSISGGDGHTQFLVGGGYHHETTVYPTDQGDSKASFHTSIDHHSPDGKFGLSFTASYLYDQNDLPGTDLAAYINTPPNLRLYDASGNLNWGEGGVPYLNLGILNANPVSFEYQPYEGTFQNLNGNLQLAYQLGGLQFKVNLGYNAVFSNETGIYPSVSLDPNEGLPPYSYFGTSSEKSWIIEPQATYHQQIGKTQFNILLGSTWQEKTSEGIAVSAGNYTSDLLLRSIAAAGSTESTNADAQYNYEGVYGRVNYIFDDRYVLNISGRRDGSSRFGPDSRFNNFGALGAAWIFREYLPFLSFGKLRSSYGIAGNDQIGDYRYLDTWTPATTTYQGISTLNPTSIYNPDFAWERNRKADIALDLGFWKDRLLFSVEYYNSRSNNQLVNYTLPSQVGFTSVLENLDAEILNYGWDIQLSGDIFKTRSWSWSTSFNMTIPTNKLVAFPGLATSSYANTYTIGQSLSTVPLYHYLGVNPATGIYQVQDVDNNGVFNQLDRIARISTDPKFYGGLQNTLRYKKLELTVFFEFRKQEGYNDFAAIANIVPGAAYHNQPDVVLSRWQNPGDVANVERFTQTSGPTYTAASTYLRGSDATISDASYIRFKNASLSYALPARWSGKMRLYLQGQNLMTITNYKGADPENQGALLPPLKTITAGIQVTF